MDKETKAQLRSFGRKANPIRMSSLPTLLQCQGFAVLRMLELDDTAGIAARNGTAIGRACELWHNGDSDEVALQKALGEAEGSVEDELIRSILTEYVQDPRNGEMAYLEVVDGYQEQSVSLRVRGKSGYFYLKGHIDQLRRDQRGRLWIFDLKNGQMGGGNQMVNTYAAQQVAYAIGMSDLLGEDVGYGGIIRLRGYVGRNNLKLPVEERPVFFETMWDIDRCRKFMGHMVRSLDDIRRGEIRVAPGTQCSYCPAGGAFNCVDMF